MTPQDQALLQAVGGEGGAPMLQEPPIEAGASIITLLERLIEAGKLSPEAAELILQALEPGGV